MPVKPPDAKALCAKPLPGVQRRPIDRGREGAAMLVVMLMLLVTTSVATFSMHAASREIRSSGFARQAMQTEVLAEGSAYAALAHLDELRAGGALIQVLRTQVGANTASTPTEASMDHETNLIRITMDDFSAGGASGLPLELEASRTPSFGPLGGYQPSFIVDGTDLHMTTRDTAGRDLSGRGSRFYRITLTSRARMAPPSDTRPSGELRTYHETAMRARAVTEVGPLPDGI